MARRTVEVTGLKEMARALDRLPDQVGRAVQEALNATAVSAQRRVGRAFDAEIEDGPTPFTKVRPGSKTSSVLARDRRYRRTSDPEASTAVQKKQSSYLKYMLDESDGVREPGEVGAAEKFNFVPVLKNVDLLSKLGVTPTRGNLPRGALRKLFRRAESMKARVERERRAGKSEADLTKLGRRLRRKRAKEREAAALDPGTTMQEIFFGVPRGQPSRQRGFWVRPRRRPGSVDVKKKITLIVSARPRSRYTKDYLTDDWNKAHVGAAKQVHRRAEVALAKALRSTNAP